ncbi:aspartyl protease family protein At5g10770-like [Typha angustifolia]|uniref:aspartyl protease family protein At5g10770-like n=1 Tax=Typha angustifolia TaxID=59011 RepID=UPI003C2FAF35
MVEVTSHLPSIVLLLWFVVVPLFSAGDAIHCLEEERVVSLQRLQGKENKPVQKCLPQRSRREKSTAILELRHHSYCLGPKRNQEYRTWNLLVSDNARVSSFQSQIENSRSGRTQEWSSQAQIPLISGVELQTMNYVVTVELGNEKMTMIVDTGSDLTWVQCKPCTACYSQQDPIFDPSISSSYKTIACNSSVCDSLQLSTGGSDFCDIDQPSCNYDLSYGDGSYSRGVLAQDSMNLAGNIIESFLFGCGRNNQGLFGGTSGLMGLGRSQISLVSQTITQFGGVFSYCLPMKEYDSSGSLVLGADSSIYRNLTPVVYTKMISDPLEGPFYFLKLTGMSIGGVKVQASGFSTGKVLIDSGTVITRLVPSVYNAVKSEFLKQFSGYPIAPGFSILDTCFNLAGYMEVKIPTIKLELEGNVTVEVDASGVLYFVKNDASQVCLALASLSYEYEVGILGNYQQKNLRVIYDTAGSRIGFAVETCDYI